MIDFQLSDAIDPQDPRLIGLEALLRQTAQTSLRHIRPGPEPELTILLSDDAQLQTLNRQFLGIEAPTDVLSFPADEFDPETEELYLGDIVISLARATAQATAGGHPVSAELQLLVVHGTLHLLGFDHASPAEKTAMWKAQAEVLTLLGCPITGPAA